jgi:hypothetical protein
MERDEYFSQPGLSNSGMKDLEVSPMRYWYKHINPERVEEPPTKFMELGLALHCAVLEPDEFDKRYACEPAMPEGTLVTMADLRSALENSGVKPKGTRKADVIIQVQAYLPNAPIADIIEQEHAAKHAGKLMFNNEQWTNIANMARALTEEPEIQRMLEKGSAEVVMTATDPETGVLLKGKMDWVRPDLTLDLKTFSQKHGKSIDQSIADAIFYEGYNRQAYFYSLLRSLQPGGNPGIAGAQTAQPFIIVFVESEPPHEVRIKELRPKRATEVNLYWETARAKSRQLIRLYAECQNRFGNAPWKNPQSVDPLYDEEIRQLAW